MARSKHYNYYNDQFKATAVALTNIAGAKATDVADALCIHPVILYRWRFEARRGQLMVKKKDIDIEPKMRSELKRLQKFECEHNLLKRNMVF